MEIFKEEEEMDTVSSLNEGSADGARRDGLSVPTAFSVRKCETEV
jgi:hypothetical protein